MNVNEGALTPREADTLRAIVTLIREHGYPPTIKEIATRMGGVSSTLINWRITLLVNKGFVRRDKGVTRGIVVLRDPPPDHN